jgi:hypothetical protein
MAARRPVGGFTSFDIAVHAGLRACGETMPIASRRIRPSTLRRCRAGERDDGECFGEAQLRALERSFRDGQPGQMQRKVPRGGGVLGLQLDRSGAYVPVADLPPWLAAGAHVSPISYAIDATRAIALHAPGAGRGARATDQQCHRGIGRGVGFRRPL